MTAVITRKSRRRRASIVALAISANIAFVACTEEIPTAPTKDPAVPGATDKSNNLAVVSCVANKVRMTVSCGDPLRVQAALLADPRGVNADHDVTLGKQNVYVTLTSTNVNYSAGTGDFTFDVTVRNLIPQPLGTTDGTTPHADGVRVLFNSGPTVTSGTGVVTVVPDGVATITGPNQPFYKYATVLDQFEVSAPKQWKINMPATVETFVFTVLVNAPVQYPDGYIDLQVGTANSVRPPDVRQITYVVRNANGEPIADPGPLEFISSSTPQATVDNAGLLTPLRAGTTTITAKTAGDLRIGVMTVTIKPIRRTWTGAVNTDWHTGGNWIPVGIVPEPTDTAVIPSTPTNFPQLIANASIGGVEVDVAPALVSIGAFDLTASGVVAMATGGQITGTVGRLVLTGVAQTVNGIAPRIRVTGTYSLSANLTLNHQLRVQGGRLRNQSFRVRINNP